MQFNQLLTQRYSCRAYKTEPVDDQLLHEVLEAARLAPSACNKQPWTFIIVRDETTRHKILSKSRPAFLDAPVVIVACGHHDLAWHRQADDKDHTDIDLAIAVEHLALSATDHGLASCWVCSFDVEATVEALSLPHGVEPVALLPVGYAAEGDPLPQKIRKPMQEIIRWEKY